MATENVDINAIRITSPKRALMVECMERQQNRGLDPLMTEGYFRTEVVLSTQTASGVQFELRTDATANGQPIQPWERRLNINDAFYMTHLSVMFYAFTTNATPATEQANRAAARLQAFPNERVFGTFTPSVINMYNGYLSLQVDSTVFIPSLDMRAFMFADYAQQGTAVSSVATTGVLSESNWEGDRGWKQLTDPLTRLNGPGNTQFGVKFATSIDMTTMPANTGVAAVLYGRGWKAQNAGAFRPGN